MTSREKILGRVRLSQAKPTPLPSIDRFQKNRSASVEKFKQVLEGIGGKVVEVSSLQEVEYKIAQEFTIGRIVTTIEGLPFNKIDQLADPHELSNVELAIVEGILGIEENGAIWISEDRMVIRALPFICQHLAIVMHRNAIVPGLAEAYQEIEKVPYSFGTFLAGPSKTADIEQSLVLGAHGARTLTVFLTS